ncbi:MAG: exodeoxyribonuclease VII large subunit [Eubacterium sp.]|nr:exodeoxyribonuclease VII large subunit [Eubacterium sp.]
MKEYTVSQVNGYIKNLISSDYLLRNIVIRGEISNCKYHSMGHIYFTLKDESSSMPCVMFKGSIGSGLKFRLEDGQAVLITGSVNVYERDGRYQLYASKILLADDGKGKLAEEYEKLKIKLYEEGLFDFEIKKPIPKHPKAVGIVTAKTGAAIQDIMNIARRRNPYVQLYLYPAKVQGEGAAETIVRGIETLDKMGLDTIIIGRGGGSIEDLWAFNEEIVARAVFAAKTPIISGTGHEIDNTIADYVADLRAPTPSAAAELAIDNVIDTLNRVKTLRTSIDREMSSKVRDAGFRLEKLKNALERLSPESILRDRQLALAQSVDKLHRLMEDKLTRIKQRLEVDITRLHGLSPTAKLVNGFGYISDSEDKPVTSVRSVKEGDSLTVRVHDGTINTKVMGTNG